MWMSAALAYTLRNRITPSLSTMMMARSGVPRSSLYRPYARVTFPLGWKSDSNGYGRLPSEVA